MATIMQIITSPNADNKQKDGALHMIGTLADVLLKKALYRDQVESMLTTYVFPEFQNPAGHMRARACWVLHYFCDVQIKNPQVLANLRSFQPQIKPDFYIFSTTPPTMCHFALRHTHIRVFTYEQLPGLQQSIGSAM